MSEKTARRKLAARTGERGTMPGVRITLTGEETGDVVTEDRQQSHGVGTKEASGQAAGKWGQLWRR
ncbi:hypothetical protein [Streptomyces sp. NPDC086787]|uniref:hypothetical protein n=1 Tax=Streptomyces sp. NPDC086787 TaxID=3365759 RepID=UPI003825B7A3